MRRNLLGLLVIFVAIVCNVLVQANVLTFLEPNSASKSTILDKELAGALSAASSTVVTPTSKIAANDNSGSGLQMLDLKTTSGKDISAATTATTTTTTAVTAPAVNPVPTEKLEMLELTSKKDTKESSALPVLSAVPAQTSTTPASTVVSTPVSSTSTQSQGTNNNVITEEVRARHQQAYEMLQKQYPATDVKSLQRPFDDVLIAYLITAGSAVPSFLTYATHQRTTPPVVYSGGKVNFADIAMASLGMPVHVFDCVSSEAVEPQANVYYYPWCLGVDPVSKRVDNNAAGETTKKVKFVKTIQETLTALGHKSIDILSLDIGGYEWDILEKEILNQNLVSSTKPSEPIQLDNKLVTTDNTSGKVVASAAVATATPSTEVTFLETNSPKTTSLVANNDAVASTTAAPAGSVSMESGTKESATQVPAQGQPAVLEMLDLKKTQQATPQAATTRFLREESGLTKVGGATVKKIEFVLGDNDKITTANDHNNDKVTSVAPATTTSATEVVSSSTPSASVASPATPEVATTTTVSSTATATTSAASDMSTVPRILPDQLLFELHTKGTNPLLEDKDRNAVNRLFAGLWSLGYRVISKVVKSHDPTTAMFTLVRLPPSMVPPVTPLVTDNRVVNANSASIASSAEVLLTKSTTSTTGAAVPSVATSSVSTTTAAVTEPAVQFLNTATSSNTAATVSTATATAVPATAENKPAKEQPGQLQFLPAAATSSEMQFLNTPPATVATAATATTPAVPTVASTAQTSVNSEAAAKDLQFLKPAQRYLRF